MDEQRTPSAEPTLKRPDDSIEDLELDEGASEEVRGGDIPFSSLDIQYKGQTDTGQQKAL